MSWEIRYRASVERDVDRLPARIRVLALRKIVDLGENPFPPGCRKLKGPPTATASKLQVAGGLFTRSSANSTSSKLNLLDTAKMPTAGSELSIGREASVARTSPVVGYFDVEAAGLAPTLSGRRHVVRRLTNKLAATAN